MWYQFSSDDSFLVIGAIRCRMAVIQEALSGPARSGSDSLRREYVALERIIQNLYDCGSWSVPGVPQMVADCAAKIPGAALAAPRTKEVI